MDFDSAEKDDADEEPKCEPCKKEETGEDLDTLKGSGKGGCGPIQPYQGQPKGWQKGSGKRGSRQGYQL